MSPPEATPLQIDLAEPTISVYSPIPLHLANLLRNMQHKSTILCRQIPTAS